MSSTTRTDLAARVNALLSEHGIADVRDSRKCGNAAVRTVYNAAGLPKLHARRLHPKRLTIRPGRRIPLAEDCQIMGRRTQLGRHTNQFVQQIAHQILQPAKMTRVIAEQFGREPLAPGD